MRSEIVNGRYKTKPIFRPTEEAAFGNIDAEKDIYELFRMFSGVDSQNKKPALEQMLVFWLHYPCRLPQHEIAVHLGISDKAANNRIYEARKKALKVLGNKLTEREFEEKWNMRLNSDKGKTFE
ncbi:MAG TPA: sigma-70 region 4 domain-containing protein [Patescibacteria group bacterium]|nr:sigma-70 region 4 domain-containing protein [Patescibacteria group bacterium]